MPPRTARIRTNKGEYTYESAEEAIQAYTLFSINGEQPRLSWDDSPEPPPVMTALD